MKSFALLGCWLILFSYAFAVPDTLIVKQASDFTVNGKGTHPNWELTSWVPLKQLDEYAMDYSTRFKILYSAKGVYVLFEGLDQKVTTTYTKDFDNLFNADVFEVFFHTDTSIPLYFEYEVNALDKELVLFIPHFKSGVGSWIPWHYEGERKVRKKVFVYSTNEKMEKWSAEMFFPFGLLTPLGNVPAVSGTYWNANFYRLDYDGGKMVKFAWSPVEKSFHEYKRYGTIRFE
jgi:hypothetical protein